MDTQPIWHSLAGNSVRGVDHTTDCGLDIDKGEVENRYAIPAGELWASKNSSICPDCAKAQGMKLD